MRMSFIGRFDALVREQGMQHATIHLFTSDHGQTVTANERDDEVSSDPDHDGDFIPYDGSIHGRYEVEGHPGGTAEEPFRVDQLQQVFNSVPERLDLQGQLFLSDEAEDQLASVMGNSTQHLRRSIIFSPNGGMAFIYVRQPGDRNVAEHPDTWRMPDFTSIRDIAVTLVRAALDGSTIDFPEFTGSLGQPPVVLVRENAAFEEGSNTYEYKWLRIIPGSAPVLLPLSDLAVQHPLWERLEQRIRQLDDKGKAGGIANTRCGDIIMIMNTADGFNSVHEGDAYPGWHGGPSKADSIVPFALTYPGIHLPGNSWLSELPTALVGREGALRNRQMTQAVRTILQRVRQ